jgi:hypothetical protein
MKSLGTSGSATRRVFSYKVGGTLEEILLEYDFYEVGGDGPLNTCQVSTFIEIR